jgi:outer membrane receptor for ferrienterochelin and colicins
MSLLRGALLLIVLVMTHGLAFAKDNAEESPTDLTELTIEELMEVDIATVYGASRFSQKTIEAPASVTIVTSQEIRQYGYRNLAEVLQSVPGFYTSYDRNYDYLGIRGFSRPGDYNSRFLLVVDGHKLNDNIYESASIGNEFILDVDLIDRVEVIRGPSSSLYGTNAFLGVINILTKKAQDYNGAEVSGEVGSYDTYKGRITYGQKFKNGFELLASVSYLNSTGQSLYFREFDSPATHFGRADSCDYEKYGKFFATLKYNGFTLQGAYNSRTKGIPTGSYETIFNAQQNHTTDQAGYIDLRYDKDFSENTNLMVRAYYNHYNYEGKYVYNYPPLAINQDGATGKWWGTEVKLVQRLFQDHKVTVGGEFQDNFLQEQKNYDERPYSLLLYDKRSSYVYALYLQDEFSILKNLLLNAGVRYDYYETFGGTTNPRAALIYQPFDGAAIKLIYGMAFRAPNMYELYYEDNGSTQKANPDLKPEKITTYELVLEQYLKNYRFSLAGFYYQIRDLISQQIDPKDQLLVFRNIDKVNSKGIEFQVEGKWKSGLSGRFSYSYQQAEIEGSGSFLTNSPRHLLKLNTAIPIVGEKLSAGAEILYTSDRKTVDGGSTGGYTVANITLLSRELIKNLEISGTVYNLFDKKYSDPGGAELRQNAVEQNGITYRIKCTYRF